MKNLIQAEWRVLTKRSAARGLLLVSALVPVLVTVVLGLASGSEMEFNGRPIREVFSFSGPHAATLSLRVRHALILPMFVLFVTGASVASERANHMLRERLVRAVSRDALLVAKVLALLGLCSLSLAINALVALSLGTVWMGAEGPWSSVFLGHFVSVWTDLGLIALGVFLSTIFRSGAMVVVSGLLIFLFDQALNAGLSLLGFIGVGGTDAYQMFLPSTGWNAWVVMLGEEVWFSILNLILWTIGLLFLARHRLTKMDVP